MTISRPIALTDKPDATELKVAKGEIEFKGLTRPIAVFNVAAVRG